MAIPVVKDPPLKVGDKVIVPLYKIYGIIVETAPDGWFLVRYDIDNHRWVEQKSIERR